MGPEHRAALHQAIADASQEIPELGGAMLVRWVLLAEFAVPNGQMAFQRLSGQADGRPLVTWDVDGLLMAGFRHGRREPPNMRRSEDLPDSLR